MESFENDIVRCIEELQNGGVILYPTDTVWGLGCDATNEAAVKKIYRIKQRDDAKSLIVLLPEEKDVLKWVAAPDLAVFEFLEQQVRPTTVIFEQAVGLPATLVAEDGSIAIRLTSDPFCRHLLKRLRRPLVSTSANISGSATPQNFTEIASQIKDAVDYVVQWRQYDDTKSQPSQIIRWKKGKVEYLRK